MTSTRVEGALHKAVEKLGYTSLREKQKAAVLQFARGKDVFVSLPTGSGKSLCFYTLPLLFDILRKHSHPRCIAIVVSPLLALMKTQVSKLAEKGMKSTYITKETNSDDPALQNLHDGYFQLVLFSPEALLCNDNWRDMLQTPVYQENVVAFIVDEAHLVKKWGDSFRLEFSNLGEVLSLLPPVNTMALTATATKETRRAICRSLGMRSAVVISQSPNKLNVFYKVTSGIREIEGAFGPLVERVRNERLHMGRVIIFCRSYDDCGDIYHFFRKELGTEMSEPKGYATFPSLRLVDMFTACTQQDVKNIILKQFEDPNSCLRIVIATVAFGMGLDLPNVRQVIHWGAPQDIESYVQETGRAGRDGLPAIAELYRSVNVYGMHTEESMKDYCELKAEECRRHHLLQHFDCADNETFVIEKCKCCDLCAVNCTCESCCR